MSTELIKKRDALLLQYRKACRDVRRALKIKKRPTDGSIIKAKLRPSGYTKYIGTVIGTFHKKGNGHFTRIVINSNGDQNGEDYYYWGRVVSWRYVRKP